MGYQKNGRRLPASLTFQIRVFLIQFPTERCKYLPLTVRAARLQLAIIIERVQIGGNAFHLAVLHGGGERKVAICRKELVCHRDIGTRGGCQCSVRHIQLGGDQLEHQNNDAVPVFGCVHQSQEFGFGIGLSPEDEAGNWPSYKPRPSGWVSTLHCLVPAYS